MDGVEELAKYIARIVLRQGEIDFRHIEQDGHWWVAIDTGQTRRLFCPSPAHADVVEHENRARERARRLVVDILTRSKSGSFADALERHVQVIADFTGPRGLENFSRLMHLDPADDRTPPTQRGFSDTLTHAQTYFVDPAIMDLLLKTAETMPTNFVLTKNLLPSTHGFLYSPLEFFPEYSDYLHGLSWGPLGDTEYMSFFWMGCSSTGTYPATSCVWGLGHSIAEAVEINQYLVQDVQPNGVGPSLQVFQLLATFLAFMQDRILVTRTQPAPRHVQRRLARSAPHSPLINLIELRRREYQYVEREGEPQHREYSCQWIVRGHWRQQWYPSLQRHQPKRVLPYIKGDPEKPLKAPRANIFAVVR